MNIQLSDHFTYKKLIRFTLPTIAMMLFTSVYGIVDGYFVSNYVGKTAFASVNLVMPFVMIIGGMGFMVGTGGTALVAKILGEGDKKQANKIFSMMVWLTLIMGIVLSVVGVIFIKPIAYFLGATNDMIDSCVLYGRIVISFSTCFMFQNLFQSFLVAAEKPKFGLYITLIAGCLNMFLDWLLVGVLPFGVAGAAFATGISQFVGGFLPFLYFLFPNKSLLKLTKTKLAFAPILQACSNGFSELMSNISSSVVGMLYNIQLMRLYGENGVSAYGVLMYVQFIFVAVFIGYSIGVSPIISFHFGGENKAELKNLFKKSTLIMFLSGTVLAFLSIYLAPYFSMMFVGYDAELLSLTVYAFKVYSLQFVLLGFNIFASAFFTALNNGLISAIISFTRSLILECASIIILPLIFGCDGIWWTVIVTEIFGCVISTVFILLNRRKYGYL